MDEILREPVRFQQLTNELVTFARAQHLTLYVVGGAIRDALLGRARTPINLDLTIANHALATAQRLASYVGGTYICLDEATGSARIIVTRGGIPIEVDLCDFRGATLEADLAKRDFTINAMAVPLETWCTDPQWPARVLDPLGGQQDLRAKIIRACFADTFREDPVRILRALRFAVDLELTLDPSIGPMIAEAAPGLPTVSDERVRDELFAIFQTDRAGWALHELDRLGVLEVLVPEVVVGRGVDQGGYHHLDVFEHQVEAVVQCDRIVADFAEFSPELRAPLADYCRQMPVERRSRKALIKLASLFHDVGKPATRRVKEDGEIWFLGHEQFGASLMEAVGERFKLSNRERHTLEQLVLFHLRPGHLSREPTLTARAIFRFFRDLGDDGPACLLLWWADRMATRGPSSRLDQIDQQRARLEELLRAYFFKPEEAVKPPRLVDGHELMRAFGLAPGPRVGELLEAIQEAQAEGAVRTKEEALTFARIRLHEPPHA